MINRILAAKVAIVAGKPIGEAIVRPVVVENRKESRDHIPEDFLCNILSLTSRPTGVILRLVRNFAGAHASQACQGYHGPWSGPLFLNPHLIMQICR